MGLYSYSPEKYILVNKILDAIKKGGMNKIHLPEMNTNINPKDQFTRTQKC